MITFSPTKAQIKAREFLDFNDKGWLIMGAGLGKTATMLHKVSDMLVDMQCKAVLVVAPIRVCDFTWNFEAHKWKDTNWLKVSNLRTKQGWLDLVNEKSQIYLCNYEMLPRVSRYLKVTKLKPAFDVVIFDETTKAKNPSSKRINCVRKGLHKCCNYVWGLTGTPTPNSLMEAFAQVRLIDDGVTLGQQVTRFRQTYFDQDYSGYRWEIKPHMKKVLEEKISTMSIVLTREEYLDIPDIVLNDHSVELPSDIQENIYKELQEEMFLALQGQDQTVIAQNAAVLVNKLLQIASGAVYLQDDEGNTTANYKLLHKEKLNTLEKIFKDNPNENFLLLYNFRHERERIISFLESKGLTYGGLSAQDNPSHSIEEWNHGELKVLMGNPASMGHGLNLQHGGSSIVWFSLTWSRELYDQAIARLARTGQTELTKVHRIITSNTVENVVAETLKAKGETQKNLLDALIFYKELQEK